MHPHKLLLATADSTGIVVASKNGGVFALIQGTAFYLSLLSLLLSLLKQDDCLWELRQGLINPVPSVSSFQCS